MKPDDSGTYVQNLPFPPRCRSSRLRRHDGNPRPVDAPDPGQGRRNLRKVRQYRPQEDDVPAEERNLGRDYRQALCLRPLHYRDFRDSLGPYGQRARPPTQVWRDVRSLGGEGRVVPGRFGLGNWYKEVAEFRQTIEGLKHVFQGLNRMDHSTFCPWNDRSKINQKSVIQSWC